jgi:hypothetical protein
MKFWVPVRLLWLGIGALLPVVTAARRVPETRQCFAYLYLTRRVWGPTCCGRPSAKRAAYFGEPMLTWFGSNAPRIARNRPP